MTWAKVFRVPSSELLEKGRRLACRSFSEGRRVSYVFRVPSSGFFGKGAGLACRSFSEGRRVSSVFRVPCSEFFGKGAGLACRSFSEGRDEGGERGGWRNESDYFTGAIKGYQDQACKIPPMSQ